MTLFAEPNYAKDFSQSFFHSHGRLLVMLSNISLGWKGKHSYYDTATMEQCTLKNVNNYLNTNIYSFLETSGGQSFNLCLNVVHFFNARVN
jgi:hypothetical protein